MATHKKGQTIKTIIEAFEDAGMGYEIKWEVLNSVNYGVAQERRRIVVVGIRKYIRYDSTKPSVCVTGNMRKVFTTNKTEH